MMRLVTILGGSGFVGRYVAQAMAREGWRVRVACRRPNQALFVRVYGPTGQVEPVGANIRDEASLRAVIRGADAVVNCVGILAEAGPNTFDALQSKGAGLAARVAAEEGVTRFVQVSAIGADEGSRSGYARTKGEGERLVAEAMPHASVLRPSLVFGPEDQFFNRFASMARFAPALPLIGGRTRFQPVYVGDVAAAVTAALTAPETPGGVYELGGPQVYTFKELMTLMLEEIRRPRWLAPTPFPVAWLLGLVGEASGMLPFVEPFLTRDQVTLLKRDNVVTPREGVGTLADLGVAPTAVEAIIPRYLERYRRHGQFHEDLA